MTGQDPGNGETRPLAAELRLRPNRPSVTRLSRRVLIGLGTVASLSIFGLTYWALQTRGVKPENQELYNTRNQNIADGVTSLPSSYNDLPKPTPPLGPPLPGDLGPPILHAEQQGRVSTGNDQADQQLAQEQNSARTSSLFVQTATPTATSGTGQVASPDQEPGYTGAPSPTDPTATQNMQDQKLAFLNGPSDAPTVSPDRLTNAASPYIVQAGSVIPAALITGIRSDLPGQVTAQVTENVYDSPTGQYLLIPQGSKLIGEYNSEVAFAQSRVQLVWTRLILPNGRSIVLENQPGADTQGYSGLQDGVDNHWGSLFEAALLSTFLSVGAEAGTGNQENSLVQAIRSGASDSINQTGQELVERELNIQPTLTIRPGFPVRVIVNRDLVLAPYQG
ncbi:conjugal transfer protein TrbI [Acidocella aquatica]|uniref:Conjugal transfer protein TrbI n=1 Tax=Acidocella aquatica TaxID=1922313 RepID=A0ABQ6A895_9PROT|nr:TrbI/VirB10 family protein [Acidocella aquatica]GLR68695.1 conjugal transfer protein TrbI [Acidocella aquatica]